MRLTPPTNRRTVGVAAAVLVHLVLVGLTLFGRLDRFYDDAMHRLGRGTDFSVYVDAGTRLWHGLPLFGEGPAFGFRYHPLLAAWSALVGRVIPPAIAYWLWCGVIELGFIALVAYVVHRAPRERVIPLAWLCALYTPLHLEIFMGQLSFVSGVLVLGRFIFLANRRLASFTVAACVAVIAKPIALVLAPAVLDRRTWRPLAVGAGALAGSAALYFALMPGEFARFVAVNFVPIDMAGWMVHAGHHGLNGFLTTLFTRESGIPVADIASLKELPAWSRAVLAVYPAGVLALAGLTAWRRRPPVELAALLWTCSFFLVYKDIWEHSYAFMLVPLVIYFCRAEAPSRLVIVGAIVIALPTAFVFYDVPLSPGPNDPERLWSLATSLAYHATKPAGVIVIMVGVLRETFGSRSAARPSRRLHRLLSVVNGIT
jgi:hypothetical protein